MWSAKVTPITSCICIGLGNTWPIEPQVQQQQYCESQLKNLKLKHSSLEWLCAIAAGGEIKTSQKNIFPNLDLRPR